jgi:hypothetical protein
VEIARVAAPALAGPSNRITLAAGYANAIGFTFPLVVGGSFNSSDLYVVGVNSYMLVATLAAPSAGLGVTVFVTELPPSGAGSWAPFNWQVGTIATVAGGTQVVSFGSRGRDQATDAQGFCSSQFVVTLSRVAAPAATFTNVRLFVMTRP